MGMQGMVILLIQDTAITAAGMPDKRTSFRTRYEFDETIFRPQIDQRVELPQSDAEDFEELQPFDQVWLWALMGFELVFVMILMVVAGVSWPELFGVIAIMLVPLALLSSIKLRTRIDREGVHYRMVPFHFKERTIPWSDIDQIYVRKYDPLKEYGGWGIKYGLKGLAINVKGKYGIQIVKTNGKRILLGTQDPERAAKSLEQHPLLV